MTAPDGSPVDALNGRATALDALDAEAFPTAGQTLGVGPRRRGARSGYRVVCPPAFARAVEELAAARGCDVTGLAAAALLLAGANSAYVDPDLEWAARSEADGSDEAGVLVVRLPAGLEEGAIRRALALALALSGAGDWRLVPASELTRMAAVTQTLEYRNKGLANALARVAFQPLEGGIREVRDAAQLFGFVNEWCFDEDRLIRRFRELAPIYHPDTGIVGCRERMTQLIEARNLLIRHVRTAYSSGAWANRRA